MPATRRLARLAVASAVVVVLTHFLRIFTEWGQRWEDDAFLEAQALSAGLQDVCDALLSALRIPTIAALVVAYLVIAAYRRQVLTGLAIAFAFAGALVSAEVLAILIPRPDLAADLTALIGNDGANTFPSGHATIATALGLAFITVVAPRWRPWVAVIALAFTIAVACSTVIAGWHRPSDAVGGIALATAWLAGAASLLSRWRGVNADPGPNRAPVAAGLIVIAASLVMTATLALSAQGGFLVAFATAEALVIAAAGTLQGAYAFTLQRVDFTR